MGESENNRKYNFNEARPQSVLQIPGDGWPHVAAAAFTAFSLMLLTVKAPIAAAACGVVAIAAMLRWAWSLDPGHSHRPVQAGEALRLPVYATGASSTSWWASVVLILVGASLFTCLGSSYLYLWTVAAGYWPSSIMVPPLPWPLTAAALLAASSGAVACASYALGRRQRRLASAALVLGIPLLVAASVIDARALWQSGVSPAQSVYGAAVYAFVALQGCWAAIVTIMALYTVARERAGLLDRGRRVTFDNTMLLWHYTVAQGLAALALLHGFPRIVP